MITTASLTMSAGIKVSIGWAPKNKQNKVSVFCFLFTFIPGVEPCKSLSWNPGVFIGVFILGGPGTPFFILQPQKTSRRPTQTLRLSPAWGISNYPTEKRLPACLSMLLFSSGSWSLKSLPLCLQTIFAICYPAFLVIFNRGGGIKLVCYT